MNARQGRGGRDQKKTGRPLPTLEEVRALLDYDPETGIFRWRKKPSPRTRAGSVAGCLNSDGYARISIDDRLYPAHRLAWLLTKGTWPQQQIDHADGQRSNNALANLREVSAGANQQNLAKRRRPASSKYLGVSWNKAAGRWIAQICLNGKQHYLGSFASEQDAYAAYLAAKSQLHTAQPVPRASAYNLTASEKGNG
jgi:hypothetical protein